SLRVDGGAAVNDALLQFQADLLGTIVRRPQVSETTALGAAYLAGLAVGYWSGLDEIERNWRLEKEFRPSLDDGVRNERYRQWRRAVVCSRGWIEPA
ncbi:MAG: FGGY-family carbohydrate kinase, partial [Planctomycetia bacterium]